MWSVTKRNNVSPSLPSSAQVVVVVGSALESSRNLFTSLAGRKVCQPALQGTLRPVLAQGKQQLAVRLAWPQTKLIKPRLMQERSTSALEFHAA